MDSFNITDFQEILDKIIPGMVIRNSGMGASIQWSIRAETPFVRTPDRETAEREIRILAEEMRHKAIRELGVDTILQANNREIRRLEYDVKSLNNIILLQKDKIASLQELINDERD